MAKKVVQIGVDTNSRKLTSVDGGSSIGVDLRSVLRLFFTEEVVLGINLYDENGAADTTFSATDVWSLYADIDFDHDIDTGGTLNAGLSGAITSVM